MNITNIIDVVIVLFIGLSGVVGLKRGFIKQGVATIGLIITVILAFILKNPVAEFLSLNLPFFKIDGVFRGLTVVNILFYQVLSFIIVISILQLILNAVIKVSNILEKILKFTIILGIPSKILGFILGLIEGFIFTYVVLFFLTQPLFNIDLFNDSKLTPKVLRNIPVLSSFSKSTVDTFNEVYELGKVYTNEQISSNEYNKRAVNVMLKNKIVTVSYIEKLENKGKINIAGIDEVLNNYR